MTAVARRTVLKRISAGAISAAAIVRSRGASAALPPLPNLPASEALLLRPGDSQFAQYERAFNARTQLTPQLRAMCKNARETATVGAGACLGQLYQAIAPPPPPPRQAQKRSAFCWASAH